MGTKKWTSPQVGTIVPKWRPKYPNGDQSTQIGTNVATVQTHSQFLIPDVTTKEVTQQIPVSNINFSWCRHAASLAYSRRVSDSGGTFYFQKIYKISFKLFAVHASDVIPKIPSFTFSL